MVDTTSSQDIRAPQDAKSTPARTDDRSKQDAQRGDRPRSIQTGRESSDRTSAIRRPIGTQVYGPGGSPFAMMRRMADDMDRIFENFGFGRPGMAPSSGAGLHRDTWPGSTGLGTSGWAPQVETFRKGDKFVVRADLPGLRKEDVKVEVDDGMLTITGERCDEHEENRDDFYRSERSYGEFYRSVPLPEGVTGEHCEATFKDGVLEVMLAAPKEQERKPTRVPIR